MVANAYIKKRQQPCVSSTSDKIDRFVAFLRKADNECRKDHSTHQGWFFSSQQASATRLQNRQNRFDTREMFARAQFIVSSVSRATKPNDCVYKVTSKLEQLARLKTVKNIPIQRGSHMRSQCFQQCIARPTQTMLMTVSERENTEGADMSFLCNDVATSSVAVHSRASAPWAHKTRSFLPNRAFCCLVPSALPTGGCAAAAWFIATVTAVAAVAAIFRQLRLKSSVCLPASSHSFCFTLLFCFLRMLISRIRAVAGFLGGAK
eukprot:6197258-Pleurochrysis_carterae.AAC.1